MTDTHTDIIVAARGWSHAAWLDNFYPDDLPEDWRLSYYSNEFRAVVVPAVEFVDIDPLEVERWEEDTGEEFRFYVEVEDPLTDWEKFAKAAKPLGAKLGGILLRPAKLDADLAIIASCLDAATAVAPVCLLLPKKLKMSAVGKALLAEHGVVTAWEVGDGEPDWRYGGFAVARVSGNNHYTPRQWRETIEACLRCGSEDSRKRRTVLLMVEHDAPDPEALRAAMMIGDMLVIPDI